MLDFKMHKEEIVNRMKKLDERADLEFEGDGRFQIVIVGGGALVLRGYIARATDDIDTLETDSKLFGLMELYDINGRANAYINSFLWNYPDRIELFMTGKKIDYFTASLEDIVVSKLCADREQDLNDLAAVADVVNWELLDKLVNDKDELRLITMSDRGYMNFQAGYEIFERRYRPCKD